MKRRRGSSASEPRARRGPSPLAGFVRLMLSTPVLTLLLWLVAVGSVAFGLQRLEPQARSLAGDDLRVKWINLPVWLTHPNQAEFLAQRAVDTGLRPSDNVFDKTLCQRVAENLRQSPWIEDVRHVAARFDGVVEVEAAFRTPLAMVERGGRAFLVDSRGVRLPLEMPADQVNRQDWFVIHGVQGPVPRAPGQPWEGDDLAAGLRLVDYLLQAHVAGNLPGRGALRGVDVSNYRQRESRARGELVLLTTNPKVRVVWGLAPGEESGVERSTPSKLSALNELYQNGQLLTQQGEIDLCDPDRVVLRRIN